MPANPTHEALVDALIVKARNEGAILGRGSFPDNELRAETEAARTAVLDAMKQGEPEWAWEVTFADGSVTTAIANPGLGPSGSGEIVSTRRIRSALVPAGAEQGWRPMDSAPRDGADILAYHKREPHDDEPPLVNVVHYDGKSGPFGWRISGTPIFMHQSSFEAWMPCSALPLPPSPDGGTQP